ncbi:MAG: NAD(P)H-hydrate dehydratase [Clostridia bacterium]|nr:NAD(P)H-hydrate dehydratase [Clostridia bacterium]
MDKREEYVKVLKKFDGYKAENVITQSLVANAFKKRSATVHKGSVGRLLILGGSVGMTGAAIMAAQSSARCGCGLVTLASAQELNTIYETRLTEVMTCPLPSENGSVIYSSKDKIALHMQKCDAFLIGPGLSRSKDITRLVSELITESNAALVIDADGLNALAENVEVLKHAKQPVILTPHVGEFSRLTLKSVEEILQNPQKHAVEFAKKYNVTLILKSHRTIVVTSDGEIYQNILGNPGMAKGGSGDVLAGCVASFVAQTGNMLLSALSGVYIHSLAADMAVEEFGEYSLLPTDTMNYLKYAIKETYDDIN